ncbi:MAG: hypothetical protein Q8R10_09740 [Pseudomonas sp.]|uniref:hypothetical protein n=1 Tax=Pseudomonas sp. TaxID=306 RepID=UPI002736D34D|nr:hypothetical protein [Pseudomonas sp.]MDP3846691.1 hypothetical protein [Pseudomonas sp.]
MSLQALYALFNAQPARCLNLLALFLACAGAWLLLATRQREQAVGGSLAMSGDGNAMAAPTDEPTQRLNRFFYQFGFACMAIALLLSWGSSQW